MNLNRLHIFAGLLASILAFAGATAASAQVYKWVDERGQVNYSSQPPADPKSAIKLAVVEDRVSVYTPDATLLREIEAERQRASRAAQEKPEPYKPAVAMIGSPAPAPSVAVEPALHDLPVVVVGGFRPQRPLHKVPQVKLPAGTIAGTSVGLFGIMPGSSAPVPGTWTSTAQQPAPRHAHRPAPRHPWER